MNEDEEDIFRMNSSPERSGINHDAQRNEPDQVQEMNMSSSPIIAHR